MSKTVVYVSHPIKGLTERQIVELEGNGAAWCEGLGCEPLLPRTIDVWRHEGLCPDSPNGAGTNGGQDAVEHSWGCYMRADLIALLKRADAILMMPGWELSNGARFEMQVALVIGIPVHFWEQS